MIDVETSHIVVGIVTRLHESKLGWVRVKLPHCDVETDFFQVLTPMGGPDRGCMFLPEPGDHVLVGFEHGNVDKGFILGALWSDGQKPPAGVGPPGKNHVRLIRSRSGHLVRLDDTPGKEKIELIGRGGEQQVVIDTAAKKITVAGDAGDVEIRAPRGKVSVKAASLEIHATGEIAIKADQKLTLHGATVEIN